MHIYKYNGDFKSDQVCLMREKERGWQIQVLSHIGCSD